MSARPAPKQTRGRSYLSIAQHFPQGIGRQNADAAIGQCKVPVRLELAQDGAGRGAGDIGHMGEIVMTDVDLDQASRSAD